MLMAIDDKDALAGVAVLPQGAPAVLLGLGRGGKEKLEKLDAKMIAMTAAPRGRKGKLLDVGFKVTGVMRG